MRISLGDVNLWFDVSGPGLDYHGDTVVQRPALVAVHGGPGLDHTILRDRLSPLTGDTQIVYYDQRGHGRSDYSSAGHWNLRTWASDLRRFTDALGLALPIVLGSSFGGFVTVAYAGLFPSHPGGIILANTTGGRLDHAASIEIFRRIGGDHAASVARRTFTELTPETEAAFTEVCLPLYSSQPGFTGESRRRRARAIETPDVGQHYFAREAPRSDPWDLLPAIRCPVLILAGEDDPMCPLPLVEDLARQFRRGQAELVRLPGARHEIFRDRPDLVFPAISGFIARVRQDTPAGG